MGHSSAHSTSTAKKLMRYSVDASAKLAVIPDVVVVVNTTNAVDQVADALAVVMHQQVSMDKVTAIRMNWRWKT